MQATTAYVFVPVATDSETPQSLSFSIVNKPAWASFSTTTGRLSGTPTASQAGVYRDIIIRVSDGSLSASLPAFSITVTAAPNRAPTISGSPATVVTAGTAYSFRPSASDPDGQTLSYTISNKPAWATFSSTSGRLSGTPGNGHVGTTSGIVITVSDGMFTASLPPFSVTVNAPSNRAPTVSGTPSTAVTLGNAYRFAPSATDPDGDSLVWSIAGKPTGATFSTTTGELTWTPSSTGAWTNIVITVTDAKGASTSLPAFSIVVNAPVKAPSATLLWLPPTEFTDGSALPGTGISGYRVYHGTSIATLRAVAEVDERTTNFTVPDLARGTHYFAVTAVSAAGLESALSAVGSKTVQ